jgi:hypothetical protein
MAAAILGTMALALLGRLGVWDCAATAAALKRAALDLEP